MDRFHQFAKPQDNKEKRGFFARLFGIGKEEEESPAPPKAPPPPNQPNHAPAKAKRPTPTNSRNPTPTPDTKQGRSESPTATAAKSGEKSPTKLPAQSRRSPVRQPPSGAKTNPITVENTASIDEIKKRQEDNKSSPSWIADANVPMCYECETAFSVLVRRNHCRTCGQIFCGKCTRKTAPGEISGYPDSIRICNFCYNILLQHPDISADVIEQAPSGDVISRLRASVENEPMEEELLSKTNKRVSLASPMKDPDELAAALGSPLAASSFLTNLQRTQSGNAISVKVLPISMPLGNSSASATESREPEKVDENWSASEIEEEADTPIAEPGTVQVSQSDEITTIYRRKQTRKHIRYDSLSLPNPTDDEKQKIIAMSEQENEEQPANKALLLRAGKKHMSRLVTFLTAQFGLHEQWQSIILSLANQVTENIKVSLKHGDKMDIRHYIKIKKLPGGSTSECTYVDGIVFSKNRAHKKMIAELKNPKILLLGSAIEFERSQQKLISFDKLLIQERDYLKLVVSKIASVKPDILFVEKNVARIAQEYLLESGICLFANVKPSVMQVLSRITLCPIVQSIEHLITGGMGQAGQYKVESFSGPWGTKAFTTISGVRKDLYATIVLRGAPDDVLTKVKSALLFLAYAYRNAKLEGIVLSDDGGAEIKREEKAGKASTQVTPSDVLSVSWVVAVPPELTEVRLSKQGISISRLVTKKSAEDKADKASEQTTGEEDSESQICPTLLRIPHRPELSLSCSVNKVWEDEERVAQLALNFSYRTLLQPVKPPEFDPIYLTGLSGPGMKIANPATKFVETQLRHQQLTDQHLIYLHSLFCNTTSSQCTPFEWQIINFYSQNDLTLGQFLEYFCFSNKMKCCTPDCMKPMLEHERCFMHNTGRINIIVQPWPQSMITNLLPQMDEKKVYMWAYCKQFNRQTPYMVPMSPETQNYSFGKYLELMFYGSNATCRTCSHPLYRDHLRYFYYDGKVARFEYEAFKTQTVTVPPMKVKYNDSDQLPILQQELEDVIFLSKRIHERVISKFGELEDFCGPSDLEERKEIAEFRKMQEKEKLTFFEKIQKEEERIAKNQATLFDIYELRRALYAVVKTWNSTLLEHEIRFQKVIPNAKTMRRTDNDNTVYISKDATLTLKPVPVSLTSSTGSLESSSSAEDPSPLDSTFKSGKSTEIKNPSEQPASLPIPTLAPRSAGSDEAHSPSPSPITPREPVVVASASASFVLPREPTPEVPKSDTPKSSDSTSPPGSGSIPSLKLPTMSLSTPTGTPPLRGEDLPRMSPRDAKNDPLLAHLLPQTATASSTLMYYPIAPKSSLPTTTPQERKSIFNAISHILPSSARTKVLDVMEDSKVHIFAGSGPTQVCVAVHENEPSSIIAFALNSEEYLSDLQKFKSDAPAGPFMDEAFSAITSSANTTIANEWKQESVWGGPKLKFSCTNHFAHQFTWLRKLVGLSEEKYTLSLARCRNWAAKGGKTNSRFAKTLDGRFILKEIQPIELQAFLAFAPLYFDYFSKVYFQQVPTAIAKIVGIYSITIKTPRKEEKQDFIVMENLFYGHNISKTFDLKGSLRSRYAEGVGTENFVAQDENLLEIMFAEPICVTSEAKALLGITVWNDTLCLSSMDVMDYSLLVGLDEESNELIIGIIDYMRTYTWDKQLETWVKRTGILGGGFKKVPTIISPKQYKKRFRNAMWNYFLMVPNITTSVAWSGSPV